MTANNRQQWLDAEKFVGREEEIAVFAKMLENPKGEKRTLYIEASGGQGKTWLIKKMLWDAGRDAKIFVLPPNKIVDMYSTSNRYLEGLLSVLEERINGELQAGDIFQNYYIAKDKLETARKKEGYSQETISLLVTGLATAFRSCLQKITQEQIVVLAFDTFENVHDAEVFDWIFSDSGLQMPNLVCLIGTRAPLTKEQNELYSSVQVMTLGGVSDAAAIKLFLSYTGNKDGSVDINHEQRIRILNQKAMQNPLMLGLALIYLDLPNKSLEEIKHVSQEEFEKEIVVWLSPQTNLGSIPFMDYDLSEQMRLALILMAYMNRRFNKYFLQKIVDADYIHPDTTVESLWSELERKKPELFYVKERPNEEVQLHDKLAELLRRHVLPIAFSDTMTKETLRRFINNVVIWYDEWITFVNQDEKNILYAEQFAYLLRSDLVKDCPEQLLKFLAPPPDEILLALENHRRKRSDILARLIIGEAKIPLIERFGGEKKYDIYSLLGQLSEQCYDYESAQSYYKMAYQESLNFDDQSRQVLALLNQHNSTLHISPQKSFEILDIAEEICRKGKVEELLPRVLYERGYTFRITNNLSEAAKWYALAKSAAAYSEDIEMMPIILNDEGYNFLLTGEIQKARVSIRAARDHRYSKYMDLKERLDTTDLTEVQRASIEEDVRNAAMMLGLSYSTLGDLARFSNRLQEALTRYQEAIENFEYSNSRLWQAKMYFTIGETYRRIAVADFNAGRLQKYKEKDRFAEENIIKSIRLCEQYGFINELDTAYRRFGRLQHDRMFRAPEIESQLRCLDEARQYFRKALSISQETNDQLETLESLTELAFLADDYLSLTKSNDKSRYEIEKMQAKQDIDQLKKFIDECPKENRVHQFPVFEHLWEIEQAAYFFSIEDFDASLPLYIKGYIGMAKLPGYGIARYLQHLDHLSSYLKKLFSMNKNLGEKWCDAIIKAWELEGLMEHRPELPGEVEVIRDTNFLLR